MKRKNFHASFQQHGKWWIAWTEDLPGALTQGKTLEDAREPQGRNRPDAGTRGPRADP
jgi:hypothetical protein